MVELTADAADDVIAAQASTIRKLERRLEREKVARLEAEAIAERGLSDLYEKQQQLALLERIAARANEAASLEDAFLFALEALRSHTGSALANVYMLSSEDPMTLVPVGIWNVGDAECLTDFMNETLSMKFVSGRGLPGRVLASARAEWVKDVTVAPEFLRADAARRAGLRTGFAFPVLVGFDVRAVLEFFYLTVIEENDAVLALAAQIATQLARVVERDSARRKLVHDATHDALTGLANRNHFTSCVQAALTRGEGTFAVLFVDLDRFKLINDSLGHDVGDAMLVAIAGRMQSTLKKVCDPSWEPPLLGRLGGDEFTLLIEGDASGERAKQIAAALLDALGERIWVRGLELHTSASIGIALAENGYENVADIMRAADLAMYRAKSEGRSRIEVYDRELHVIASRRLSTESELRAALVHGEFRVHYQPIMEIGRARLIGFEALVRWQRQANVLVPPSQFIDIAEESGLIVEIGDQVLVEALGMLARWQMQHPRAVPITMNVNVSPRQFHQPQFAEAIIRRVTESGVAQNSLKLELTESVMVRDAPGVARSLRRLKANGIQIAIDDFGTGYSSLSYLHALPFDTLKIDRSFVQRLAMAADGRKIVQTILDLARNLEMDVVAEGVETADDLEILRDMGCAYAQGYFFSRPVEPSVAERMLTAPSTSIDAFVQECGRLLKP